MPARAGMAVPAGTRIRTGTDGRAEVTLPGQALLRMGGRTLVGLQSDLLALGEGLVLFQANRQAPFTKLQTGALQLDFRGSTGLIERHGSAYVKVLVLEGDARVYTSKLGESIVLQPGQLLITKPSATTLPDPVHFAIEQLAKTSHLMNADFAPLASRALIRQAVERQKSDPRYVPTNLMIFGRGTLVNLLPPSAAPPPAPSPSPSATRAARNAPL